MPRVPTYDNLQTSVSPGSMPSLSGPTPGDIAASQIQAQAQGMQHLGGAAGRIAMDQIQEANQVRTNDALNSLKETALRLQYDRDGGFTNLKGKDALERPDGQSLEAEYGGKLEQEAQRLAGTLGNDAQRAQFQAHAMGLIGGFRGQLMQHESAEFRSYSLSTSEGVVDTAQREAALAWRNPEAIDAALSRIGGEVYRQAKLLGKSAEWQEARAREMTSRAMRMSAEQAIEQGAPDYARALISRYGERMEAGDLLHVRGLADKQASTMAGVQDAQAIVSAAAPAMDPSAADRAFHVAVGSESGYQQFGKDGKPLTSKAGAVGIAQVMPGTGPEAAKLAGLPWDEHRYRNDAGYNAALGRAYFGEQLRAFGGDVKMAWAAYNAGPGALKKALTAAEKEAPDFAKRGQTLPADYWLTKLPKETQDYVAKNARAFEAGGGAPAKPSLAQIESQLVARAGNDPVRLDAARREAARAMHQVEADAKQREEDGKTQAFTALLQSGGGGWDSLPPSVRAGVAPKDVPAVIDYGKKLAKGEQPQTDWGLYYQLTTQPDLLKTTNLMAVRNRMADVQWNSLVTDQKKLQTERGQHLTEIQGPSAIVTTMAKEAGISDPKQLGQVMADVQARVTAAETAKGGKLTPDEMRKTVGQSFIEVRQSGAWWGSNAMPLALADPAKLLVVPDGERAQIKAALARNGMPVDDASIQTLYRKKMGLAPAMP